MITEIVDGRLHIVKDQIIYQILETSFDQITKKNWNKILPNRSMIELLSKNKYQGVKILKENTGEKFMWVTDDVLMMAAITGARQVYD